MIEVQQRRYNGKFTACINPVHVVRFVQNDLETVEVVTIATQGGLSDGKLLVYTDYTTFRDAYRRALAGEDVDLTAG